MKALIIAAGKGERLKHLTQNTPKPLVQLLGLSLLERVILSAKQAGIGEFIIVVGYLGEKIKAKLGKGEKYGVKIIYVENQQWKRGNGTSVLTARNLLKEKFILLMADHLFETEILRRLKRARLNDEEGILVIDKILKDDLDLEDATKVKMKDEKIVDIGKKIKDYNGVDCGIFLLSPSIFEALKESLKKGKENLSDGIKILARKRKIRILDVKDSFWMDIDTKDVYQKAKEILVRRLIKPTDGPISKLLNRPISTRLTQLFLKTSISPNLISFISFTFAVLSCLFFSIGGYLAIVAAGILAQLTSILDGCDGELARLKFCQSNYGGWFDAVLDRYGDAAIIFGMTYGSWRLNNNSIIWIVGFIALIGSFMNSYTADKYNASFGRKLPSTKFAIRIRIGRDIRLFLIMIGALFNQIFYTLIILGILANAESIRRLYVLRNM